MATLVTGFLKSIGTAGSEAANYLVHHPHVSTALALGVLGGIVGWVVTEFALLLDAWRVLWVLLLVAILPAATVVRQRDAAMSRRLVLSVFVAVMGMLSFRVIFDILGFGPDEAALRSTVTGLFGLICLVVVFFRRS